MLKAHFVSVGSYLPKNSVTNQDLAKTVDTSDEWIRTRTGIGRRHIADKGETAVFMATQAAREAMERGGVAPNDIDAIVLATSTPDRVFPAVAVGVQAELGIDKAFAFDVSAACSGFVYALATADAFIRSGQAKKILVVGVEAFSRLVDWEDRATCVLFGDGAGAFILEGREEEGGILSTRLHSDGRLGDILYVDGATGCEGGGKIRMQGREVFRHAVTLLAQTVDESLRANGLKGTDVDWLVPHQANQRIIDAMARKLGLSSDRVISTIEKHANTSAASVPLAFAEGIKDGRLKKGDLILMEALGGGLTWGSALLRL